VRDPRRALAAVARTGNGVVELRPGAWLVTDPTTTQRLLASRHALPPRAERGTIATSWGEDGLARWMAARGAMRPELTSSAAAGFAPVISSHTRRAVAAWTSTATIDAMAEAVHLVSAINTHYILGEPSPDLTRLVEAELTAARRARPALFGRRRLQRAQLATHTGIREHLRTPAPPAALVTALLSAGLDQRATTLAVRTMLLSSHHVPAAALAWTLHELSLHPTVQEQVRDEINAHRDLHNAELPLCRAVVHEALRLHPPVWQLRRVLNAPVLDFPKGADLLFSPHLNHRDRAAHPDPDRFDPHRWRPGVHPPPGSYLPFALGPRFCPGSHLAVAQLVAVLATILTTHLVVPRHAPTASPGVLNAPRGLRLTLMRSSRNHRSPQ
jgi:cytochrome P450